MAKLIILPFEDKPIALMYQTCAFCMGIIQGNAKTDITPWLSSKFINCRFSPLAKNKFIYYVFDRWCTECFFQLKNAGFLRNKNVGFF